MLDADALQLWIHIGTTSNHTLETKQTDARTNSDTTRLESHFKTANCTPGSCSHQAAHCERGAPAPSKTSEGEANGEEDLSALNGARGTPGTCNPFSDCISFSDCASSDCASSERGHCVALCCLLLWYQSAPAVHRATPTTSAGARWSPSSVAKSRVHSSCSSRLGISDLSGEKRCDHMYGYIYT